MSRLPYLLLTVCIGFAPLQRPAHAATTALSAAPADDMARAEKLYLDGKAKFEIAEYLEALRLWQEAYGLIPDSEDVRPIKNDLVYNMAKAQVKAYAVDHDVARLRKAKLLFEQYLGEHQSLHGDSEAAVKEREEVKAQLVEVEGLLEEQGSATPAEGPAPVDPDAAPPEDPAAEDDEDEDEDDDFDLDAVLDANPDLKAEHKKGRDMIIAGSVVTGVGVLGLLAGAASIGAAVTFNEMGNTDGSKNATNLAIAAGAFGGVAFVSGAVVLGLGIPRVIKAKKKAKQRAEEQRAAEVGFAPWMSPTGGGAVAVMRF